jgi:hypothetical protein
MIFTESYTAFYEKGVQIEGRFGSEKILKIFTRHCHENDSINSLPHRLLASEDLQA